MMTEGELIFSNPIPIDKCTTESFERVMRTLRDRYPRGWLSSEKEKLQLRKLRRRTGRAVWHVYVHDADWRRRGWACIEERKHTGEQILIEVRDDCFASKGRTEVGHIPLMELTEMVVLEATGSMLREEPAEAGAGDHQIGGSAMSERGDLIAARRVHWNVPALEGFLETLNEVGAKGALELEAGALRAWRLCWRPRDDIEIRTGYVTALPVRDNLLILRFYDEPLLRGSSDHQGAPLAVVGRITEGLRELDVQATDALTPAGDIEIGPAHDSPILWGEHKTIAEYEFPLSGSVMEFPGGQIIRSEVIRSPVRDADTTRVLTQGGEADAGDSIFRKSGEMWEIAYRGGKAFHLTDIKGLNFIHYLLSKPHRHCDVADLVAAIEKNAPEASVDRYSQGGLDSVSAGGDDYPILDEQAMAEYQERLRELAEERERAAELGDEERLSEIDEETEAIGKDLRAATGLGGRSRRFSNPRENARTRIQKQIKAAIDKISEQDRALSEHLESRIETGYSCSYNPDPNEIIAWEM